MKTSLCWKFIDVYLSTRKILTEATNGVHFIPKSAQMTPNDFHKDKEIQMFFMIAYLWSIKTYKRP